MGCFIAFSANGNIVIIIYYAFNLTFFSKCTNVADNIAVLGDMTVRLSCCVWGEGGGESGRESLNVARETSSILFSSVVDSKCLCLYSKIYKIVNLVLPTTV